MGQVSLFAGLKVIGTSEIEKVAIDGFKIPGVVKVYAVVYHFCFRGDLGDILSDLVG